MLDLLAHPLKPPPGVDSVVVDVVEVVGEAAGLLPQPLKPGLLGAGVACAGGDEKLEEETKVYRGLCSSANEFPNQPTGSRS